MGARRVLFIAFCINTFEEFVPATVRVKAKANMRKAWTTPRAAKTPIYSE
jgi:hypothetical protein